MILLSPEAAEELSLSFEERRFPAEFAVDAKSGKSTFYITVSLYLPIDLLKIRFQSVV